VQLPPGADVTTILIVEDDPALRRALRAMLHAEQFETIDVATGEEAVVVASGGGADLIVLDLGLPDIDGYEVLRRVRTFSDMPVIVLTAHHEQAEKIRALDNGADDYVTKPFDTEELFARLRAALRRAPHAEPAETLIRIDDLEIDLARRLVTRNGEQVHLTRTELSLLEILVRQPGKLLTQELLLREVWGPEYGTESNYLRVYVGQLRKKLGDDAAHPRLILTEPGIGYRWIAGEDA
jgi:two-component system, OmpR family, KDP operon response regulator KdpE